MFRKMTRLYILYHAVAYKTKRTPKNHFLCLERPYSVFFCLVALFLKFNKLGGGGGINMHKDTSSNVLSLKEFVSVHFK